MTTLCQMPIDHFNPWYWNFLSILSFSVLVDIDSWANMTISCCGKSSNLHFANFLSEKMCLRRFIKCFLLVKSRHSKYSLPSCEVAFPVWRRSCFASCFMMYQVLVNNWRQAITNPLRTYQKHYFGIMWKITFPVLSSNIQFAQSSGHHDTSVLI